MRVFTEVWQYLDIREARAVSRADNRRPEGMKKKQFVIQRDRAADHQTGN